MRHVCLFLVTKSQNTQLSAFNHAQRRLIYEYIYVPRFLVIRSDFENARLSLMEAEMLSFKFGKSFRTPAP